MVEKVTLIPNGTVVPVTPGFCPQCGRPTQFRAYIKDGRRMRCGRCGIMIMEWLDFDKYVKDCKEEASNICYSDRNHARASMRKRVGDNG